AYTDALTSLPNRTQFLDTLGATLERARAGDHGLAVLFLDLDNFKTVNDSMGHAAGDELIALAGRRIRSSVRPTDIAARIGGDEFAVIVDAIAEAEHAAVVAERIMASMETPFNVQDKVLAV